MEQQFSAAETASSAPITRLALKNGLGHGVGLQIDEDYLSPASFLADCTRVKVTLTADAPYAAFVDRNLRLQNGCEHLFEGQAITVPLSVAARIHALGLGALQVPTDFGLSAVQALAAQPTAVQLRQSRPLYFELGMKLANILGDATLAAYLLKAAAARLEACLLLAERQAGEIRNTGKGNLSREEALFHSGLTYAEQSFYNQKVRDFLRILQ